MLTNYKLSSLKDKIEAEANEAEKSAKKETKKETKEIKVEKRKKEK